MHKRVDLPSAFADLGIEVPFLQALRKMQFVEPSEIQKKLIPAALSGQDILGQARTGTGKTAAFALPVLQQINPVERLQAICLAPTRELAVQVAGEVKRLAEFSQLHVVCIYGGAKLAAQAHQLGRKPHFVVGTPGRVLDFMKRGMLNIENVRFAVLDEVDRMLDIGFRDDIRHILGAITGKHQTIFVSATIENEIKNLAKKYMTNPVEINVSQDRITVDEVDQSFVTVDGHDKFRVLRLLLAQENPPITIVFCNTRHGARKLAKKLHEAGLEAAEIHGDLIQRKRERIMDRFRKHQIKVLVATDLAARGIDVSAVTHIFNYDLPDDPEIYVHRIGRTARMGARGVAVSFATREEGKKLTAIEGLINRELPKREVEGFTASAPPPPRDGMPVPRSTPVQSRYQVSVYGGPEESGRKMPPKTLGSRFKPQRGRRR